MTEFDTKVAVVLENELDLWQKVNVTAFLMSGFAAADPSLVGPPYVDASGNEYLPMLRQPILVYGSDAAGVRRAYARTRAREVDQLAIFTRDLFATPHDEANRAAVAAVAEEELDLVGLAVRGPRKTVDKILDKLRPLAG